MKCVNVTGNTVLASVVSWLRSALNFQPEQCYEVANPDEIPSVPIAGHWWCTVAGGDGQFVEGNQDASQCSEQTEVIVTAYTRIQTDMTDHLADAQKAALLARIPLGRLGQALEVAKAVAFLASEDAAYITGAELHVNGGMYMN